MPIWVSGLHMETYVINCFSKTIMCLEHFALLNEYLQACCVLLVTPHFL